MASETPEHSDSDGQASEHARKARNKRYYDAHREEIVRKREERLKLAAIDAFVDET